MPQKKKGKNVPVKRTAKRRTPLPVTKPRSLSKPVNMRLVAPAPDPIEPPHDLVAKRAYQIWETKLRLANDSLRNWLEAESQLRVELNETNQV